MPPDARLSLSLPPTLAAIGQAQAAVRGMLEGAGAATELIFRAELVLEEMLANVVRHAGLPPDGTIVVLASGGTTGVTLTVEDVGPPFDPTRVPERALARSLEEARPGGLGLALIRRNAARLHYSRTAEGWNRLSAEVEPAGRGEA